MTDPCAGGFPCPDCGADHEIPGCPDAAAVEGEPQPVAWRWCVRGTVALGSPRYSASKPTERNAYDIQPLYAKPPEHAEDAPEGPTVEQVAAILCRGYSHTLRGLRGPAKTANDLPCRRCETWAVVVRDALNRLKGDQTYLMVKNLLPGGGGRETDGRDT